MNWRLSKECPRGAERIVLGKRFHEYDHYLAFWQGKTGDWEHKVVDHAEAYAQDGVYTNGLEKLLLLLKRTHKGSYVLCAPFHLYRYRDKQTYRFNERKHEDGDQDRFLNAVKTAAGLRLTWNGLTGKESK